jgi:signal transduction histidine kinase
MRIADYQNARAADRFAMETWMATKTTENRRVAPSLQEIDVLRRRLHDTTLQTLEYIANAGALGAGADLERVMRLAAREATELRYLLEGVVDDDPKTLAATLRCVADDALAFADHDIQLALGPMDGSLDSLTTIEVGGAVREALTNARKHAGASRVVVYAEEQDGCALVTVTDNGRGADLATARRGLGLAHSIQARCERLGGSAQIATAPGSGFKVTLRIGARGVAGSSRCAA